MNFDAIVVGAGPAGSMAALVLSRAGKRVLVLEKSHFPRMKVCGYTLNPRCAGVWQRHGLEEEFAQLPQFEARGFTLQEEGRAVVKHSFSGPGSRIVERSVLDQWLARAAAASGADYEFGVTVKRLEEDRVETSQGTFTAPVIIGADGRNSLVARMHGLSRPYQSCNRVGWQAFVDAPDLGDHVYMNVFREGYYGLHHVGGGRTSLTMVLEAKSSVRPEEVIRRYLPRASFQLQRSIHPISRPAWRVTNGRAWLVGDSARLLEPLTGEGIYTALASAELAARHILSIGELGPARASERYRRDHARLYGLQTSVNSVVRWAARYPERTLSVLRWLKRWPGLVSQMVEWVQDPKSPALQA